MSIAVDDGTTFFATLDADGGANASAFGVERANRRREVTFEKDGMVIIIQEELEGSSDSVSTK